VQKRNYIEKLKYISPSGTGTTALFLQKYLYENGREHQATVYTTPSVGDENYLKLQFNMLEADELKHPTLLNPQKSITLENSIESYI